MRISDWSSDVCSSDLRHPPKLHEGRCPCDGHHHSRPGTGHGLCRAAWTGGADHTHHRRRADFPHPCRDARLAAMLTPMSAASELIRRLDLQPHPEGGWYRETWREIGRASCGERVCEDG